MLFSISYSQRDNHKCRVCREPIRKSSPYFSSQTSYKSDDGETELGTPFIRHFKCADKGQLLGLFTKHGQEFFKQVKGFSDLSKEDQQEAMESFDEVMSSTPKKSSSKGSKKRKGSSSKGKKKKKSSDADGEGEESEEGEDGAKKKAMKKSKKKGKEKKEKKKKDENAPKRAQTAYFLFCMAKRAELKKEDPEKKIAAVQLSEMWKELSPEDKEIYQQQAKVDKGRYERQKKQYEETGSFDAEAPNEEDIQVVGPAAEEGDTSEQQPKKKRRIAKKALGDASDEEDDAGEETEVSAKEDEDDGEEMQGAKEDEEVVRKKRKLQDSDDDDDDE